MFGRVGECPTTELALEGTIFIMKIRTPKFKNKNSKDIKKTRIVDLKVGRKSGYLYFDETRKSYAYWYDSQEKYRIENDV